MAQSWNSNAPCAELNTERESRAANVSIVTWSLLTASPFLIPLIFNDHRSCLASAAKALSDIVLSACLTGIWLSIQASEMWGYTRRSSCCAVFGDIVLPGGRTAYLKTKPRAATVDATHFGNQKRSAHGKSTLVAEPRRRTQGKIMAVSSANKCALKVFGLRSRYPVANRDRV